jgi:hypothetical protein
MSSVVTENTRIRVAYLPERGSNASTRWITRCFIWLNQHRNLEELLYNNGNYSENAA